MNNKRKRTAEDKDSESKKMMVVYKNDCQGSQSNKKNKKMNRKMIADKKGKKVVSDKKKIKFEPVNLQTRISPSNLKNIIESFTDGQKKSLQEMGFGYFTSDFKFDSTPTALGMWLCKNFDAKSCSLVLSNNRKINITRELIHDILGIPMGDIKVVPLRETSTEDPTTARWRASLPLSVYDPKGSDSKKKITISRLEAYLSGSTDEGWAFKVGFLVVFFSIFAHGNKDGSVNQRFLPSLEDFENVPKLDWCTYCLECMQKELEKFNARSSFAGPVLLLALIYVNSTISTTTIVMKTLPAFKAWSTSLLNQREKEEIARGFGHLQIVEGFQLLEDPNKVLKKKKKTSKKQLEEEDANNGQNEIHKIEEMINFDSKTAQEMKDILKDNLSKSTSLLLDFDYKLKIALSLFPEDDEIKNIVEERNKLFLKAYKVDDKDANKHESENEQVGNVKDGFENESENEGTAIDHESDNEDINDLKVGNVVMECNEHFPTSVTPIVAPSDVTTSVLPSDAPSNAKTSVDDSKVVAAKKDPLDSAKEVDATKAVIAKKLTGARRVGTTVDVPNRVTRNSAGKAKEKYKPAPEVMSYLKRKVVLNKPILEEEKKIAEYLWSTSMPGSDIAFKTKHYELECNFFESLFPDVEVAAPVLNAWSITLNYEEEYRTKFSSSANVYCNTGMLLETITESVIEGDKIKMTKVFDESIKTVLKVVQKKKFRDIDLVFFPMIKKENSSQHYYLICFNLRTAEIDIIDNMYDEMDDISVRYETVANTIVDLFVDYLRSVKHPKCNELLTAKPKHVKLPCITKSVGKDSGVFVMRCMETYLGNGSFSHDLKNEEDGLKTQLKMLRVKFLAKMILLEINVQRKVILKEANAFVKKQKESSELVTDDNVNDNQHLLKKITEQVKMMPQYKAIIA